jgi:hypothetical protein
VSSVNYKWIPLGTFQFWVKIKFMQGTTLNVHITHNDDIFEVVNTSCVGFMKISHFVQELLVTRKRTQMYGHVFTLPSF